MKEKNRLVKESSPNTTESRKIRHSHTHHSDAQSSNQEAVLDKSMEVSAPNSKDSHSHSHHHTHTHSQESLRKIVNRLSRIEGHIRGIKSMVEQNSPCPDVLLQVAAVRGALDKVARIVLDEHLTECIARAAKEGDIDLEIQELKAALDRFLP